MPAAELGFGSIYVSEESGGIGLGRLEAALIMEAMAYGDPSTSAFISIHNMASWMIDRFGSAAVKQKYLPSMVTMERMARLLPDRALLGLGRGGAEDQGGQGRRLLYRLRAPRPSSRAAARTRSMSTMVRTGEEGPKGICCLVIEKDMPGVSFGAQRTQARLAFAADRPGQFR